MGKGSQRQVPADLPPEKRPGTGGYVGSTAGLDGYGIYHSHRFFLTKRSIFNTRLDHSKYK